MKRKSSIEKQANFASEVMKGVEKKGQEETPQKGEIWESKFLPGEKVEVLEVSGDSVTVKDEQTGGVDTGKLSTLINMFRKVNLTKTSQSEEQVQSFLRSHEGETQISALEVVEFFAVDQDSEDFESVKRQLEQSGVEVVGVAMAQESLQVGDQVKVTEGPWSGTFGNVIKVEPGWKVSVELLDGKEIDVTPNGVKKVGSVKTASIPAYDFDAHKPLWKTEKDGDGEVFLISENDPEVLRGYLASLKRAQVSIETGDTVKDKLSGQQGEVVGLPENPQGGSFFVSVKMKSGVTELLPVGILEVV